MAFKQNLFIWMTPAVREVVKFSNCKDIEVRANVECGCIECGRDEPRRIETLITAESSPQKVKRTLACRPVCSRFESSPTMWSKPWRPVISVPPMILWVCALAGICEFAGNAAAQGPGSPIATDSRISAAVSQLASPEYSVRERATEELSRSSPDDLPQLRAAFESSIDPDSRARLAGVIARIKYERTQKVVKLFLRETDPTITHGLEGWKSFSAYSGTSRSAKRLFLMLLERYPDLVETELETKEAALARSQKIAVAIKENQLSLRANEREDALALLYCLNASRDLMDRNLEVISYQTFRTSPFPSFLREVQSKKSLERMFRNWGSNLTDLKPGALLIMIENDLSIGRELALELAQSDQVKEEPELFMLAMQAMFKYGEKQDLPLLESWFKNTTVCYTEERLAFPQDGSIVPGPGTPNPNGGPGAGGLSVHTAEFRDAALLVAIQIEQGDVINYFPSVRFHAIRGFDAKSIVMPEGDADGVRAKRIEKWLESRKKQENL